MEGADDITTKLTPGVILRGPLVPEPVKVITVIPFGTSYQVIAQGLKTNQVYQPIWTPDQLTLLDATPKREPFDGDAQRFRLGVEALRLGLAYEYDPLFSLSIARVDPLPHQLEAVYDYFLKLPRIRFLLADDPGAGKTIMAGLLIKELKIRGLIRRILIVTPANLSFQWQREMKDKFREQFEVIRGDVLRANYGSNPWQERNQVITSVSWVSRIEDAKSSLLRSHWDLIIVDEAHKMSAYADEHKTLAYQLGEALSDMTDHYLLMTATPHKGDPENFRLFLSLLDRDVYGDVKSLEKAMELHEAPFYLRRVKEALVKFPDPESGMVEALFTKRFVYTTSFQIDNAEWDFYEALTHYVEEQSIKAAQTNSPQARAVGFTMAMLQRRFASSVYAVRRSLERMREKRQRILDDPEGYRQQQIERRVPADFDELPDDEQQQVLQQLEDAVASVDPITLKKEIRELDDLIERARLLEQDEEETKLHRLRQLLQEQGVFGDPKMKLLLFTEHKDTLDYLVLKLREWGLSVTQIHGSMKIGDRDTPGTRIYAEREFRESCQVLVATEAAGEGINLQFCWLMINYDIPWNPVRLEQRMGRIHRYGQERDCLIFNFVATNTREGSVLQKLFERLREIEDELDPKRTGKVFNVLGDIFPANELEQMVREMYVRNLTEEVIKNRIVEVVDTSRFQRITHSTLEGLAKRELNLSAIVGRSAEAKERRLVPEVIEDFFVAAAPTTLATPATTPTPAGSPTPTATAGVSATATTATTAASQTTTIGAAPRPLIAAVTYTQQTPPTTFTFNTYPPVAKFGSPDPLNVDLNSGSLMEGIKLDVPPGPAGAMPNLTLAYNSAAVSEQHSPQGAAGWVGEGWSLSLGSISWAEHNVVPTCVTSCTNSWQSQWMLNDPFGTSTELIPPNLATSTYYDDSANWWCTSGNASSTACPIQFRTARESYAKVYAYVGPITLNNQPDPFPCFRVYLKNGVMEEFGCTADSLQYYPIQPNTIPHQGNSNVVYPVNWLLDLITNPQGDQVHITYQRDLTTAPDGFTYPRDIVPATIEWDSPGCVDAKQLCTGTSWQPHYRVQFSATHHSVTRLTNAPTGCNPDATVRCDDPANVSPGVAAPLVNGTFVLNDAYVQTNNTSGGSYNGSAWNTVRDYQFSYEQSGPTQITDPVTGKQLSTAGYLDLTQFQQVGDDGAMSYPPLTFGYTTKTEYYEDGSYTPYSTAFCGPSWNTGGNGGTCDLWSQSYDGNNRYLTAIDNGQGLHQAITWRLARNNTHGATSGLGADNVNPFYCTSNPTGYPCNSADDQAWSRIVVTGRSDTVNRLTQVGQGGVQTNTAVTSSWAYTYQLASLIAKECTDCVAGMYWGNQNDGDYMDYYNGHFMGFAQAAVSNPDGSLVTHNYYATEGWGIYDTTKGLTCPSTMPPTDFTCHASPWSDVANAGHGLEIEADYFGTDGVTLLKKTTSAYNAVCPPSGVGATPAYTVGSSTFGPWNGNLVSELDHNNPVDTCDVQQTQQVATTYDGTANSITTTENYSYDSYGQVTQTQRISSSGGGSPTTIYLKTAYIRNDGLTVPPAQRTTTNQSPSSANPTWWSGAYLIDLPALQTVEDSSGSGARLSCHYTLYDGLAYTTGQASGLTKGNVTEQDTYTNCGTAPSYTPSGKVGATTSYDSFGNATGSMDPNAVNGDASHTGAPGATCSGYTSCTLYDGTTQAKATANGSVGNLNSSNGYGADAASGFGLWPTSTTDPNGQTTTYSYDALGRMLLMRAPGQSTGPATQALAYANWCPTTGAASPCVEVDTTRRTSSSSSVLTRQFFDGENRLVETRTAAPGGQDVVQFIFYNAAGQAAQSSVKYFVPAYTGPAGVDAYSIPDSVQNGTLTVYDGLGRLVQATDALSNVGRVAYSVACNAPGTGDTACYEQTLATDPNNHQQGALNDAFGRTIYAQRYTGSSPATYAVYTTTKNTYDYVGRVTQTQHPDGHTTSSSYNAAGRVTSVADPDRGLTSFTYDSNGNLTQQTDARCGATLPQPACSAGTTYTGYDGLNRPIWRNTSNTPSGAYVTYSYDGSPFGNGLGRLTAEVFRGSTGTGATSFSGAYTYTYDALGRATRTNQTMGGAGACPPGWTCQDIGGPASAGSQSYAGDGIWTVSGAGADISGTSDQFHFVSQSLPANMTISAHVDAQTYTSDWAKAGLMIRASNAANAPFYDVTIAPGHNIRVEYRDTVGGTTGLQASVASFAPAYIAIAHGGLTIYAFYSSDGVNWTVIPGSGRNITALNTTTLVGMAVTSHSTTTVSTATLDNVNVMTNGVNVCPTGWTCQDVGAPSPAGYQDFVGNGSWIVYGSGADIWGTSDQFHYVSQSLPGDGALTTHVGWQAGTNIYAKSGIMVRASNAANAPFYDVVACPNGIVYVQYRDATGATAGAQTNTAFAVPVYLKVGRVGTTYTAYTSSDGVTWTAIAGSSRTMGNLSGTVQMGLAVTSHVAGTMGRSVFDETSIALPPPNTVTITLLAAPTGIASYPIQTAYNDASQPTSLTYSDNEMASYGYDSGSGWLSSLSTTPAGGSATTLVGGIGYSGAGGAAGHATSATIASGAYNFSASYDADVRLSSLSVTNASTSAVLFSSQRGYDAASNVTAVNTTLAAGTGGTDNQAFCYDEQNRLTWAGSSGTPSCGGTLTPGTLTSASYTQTFAYDTLDRLSSGPLGTYTYGDGAHLHAVTSIGSGGTTSYTASYDAVGDMTCRAPDNTTTCAGTPTGAQPGYDNEGRLSTWQNAPTSPTTTDSFLYDGAGHRVEQSVTVNGSITTTTTYVAGGLEEISANGVSTTLTKYFTAGNGLPTAERVGTNGPLSYLASDGQGTVSEALDGGGTVTFAQLYTPYGNVRYSSGSSPTTLGYTGQRADSATGLDYYHARYYDPVAGQFASADMVADGLNRYGYVGGNPTTATDPSGRYACYDDPCTRGGGGSGSPTPSKETAPSSREPSICDDGPAICQQIISEFHNTDTQNTLLYIAEAGSSIGMRLLLWILKIGKTLGDSFIRWDGQTQGGAGYTDSGGFIHLQDLGDATNANTLIHEGVEAYYAIQYGVRTWASQQMDYLAQRYSGMYKSESGGKYDKNNGCDSDGENCMYWGAYGLSFQQWRRTADGKGYAGQPLIQAEVQPGVPIAPGYVLYRTGPFGLFLGAKAVNGGSIADLDAAYSELSVPQPIYDPAPIL